MPAKVLLLARRKQFFLTPAGLDLSAAGDSYVPSFVDRLDTPLGVAGLGTLSVDTAYGGDSFVIVDAAAMGIEIVPAEALLGTPGLLAPTSIC